MSTTDQVLTAIVIGLAICILSLCWSLQQAHHRLDELELDIDALLGEDIEPPDEIASCSGYLVLDDEDQDAEASA